MTTTEKICDCERKHYARGLCQICYQYVLRLIERGETTWKQLEAEGKVAPLQSKRRVFFKGET